MDVEPCLVFRVEAPQYLGVLPADVIVALGQIGQAPVAKLVSIVDLRKIREQ